MADAASATATAGRTRRSPVPRRHQTAATGWATQAMPYHRPIPWKPSGSTPRSAFSSSASSGMPSEKAMFSPSGGRMFAASKGGQRQASPRK